MKYSRMNLGQIEALINKVGGYKGAMQILTGSVSCVVIKPWLTVKLGTFQSKDQLFQALNTAAFSAGFDDGSGDSSKSVQYIRELSSPKTVDLVVCSLEDFGITGVRQTSEFYREMPSGLDYCPDETAAQVLLQCKVDVREIAGDHGEIQFASRNNDYGFRIRQFEGNNPFLKLFTNSPEHQRSGGEKFVFVRRQQQ